MSGRFAGGEFSPPKCALEPEPFSLKASVQELLDHGIDIRPKLTGLSDSERAELDALEADRAEEA